MGNSWKGGCCGAGDGVVDTAADHLFVEMRMMRNKKLIVISILIEKINCEKRNLTLK